MWRWKPGNELVRAFIHLVTVYVCEYWYSSIRIIHIRITCTYSRGSWVTRQKPSSMFPENLTDNKAFHGQQSMPMLTRCVRRLRDAHDTHISLISYRVCKLHELHLSFTCLRSTKDPVSQYSSFDPTTRDLRGSKLIADLEVLVDDITLCRVWLLLGQLHSLPVLFYAT